MAAKKRPNKPKKPGVIVEIAPPKKKPYGPVVEIAPGKRPKGRPIVEVAPVPLVVNVYTERECRGQGVARALMRVVMKWAAATLGSDRVVLHASDAGRPLYTSLGFGPTNEMSWFPPKDFDHH